MKHEEQIAEGFLRTYFREEPTYEPLGKGAPPDFCVGRTAFEVRRLNQRYLHNNGTAEGLEQVSYSLNRAVYGELSAIPLAPHGGSFFWGLNFERPLHTRVAKIAKEIAKRASSHYSSGSREKQTIVAHGVVVTLIPASNSYRQAFLPGYEVDEDSGGWLGRFI